MRRHALLLLKCFLLSLDTFATLHIPGFVAPGKFQNFVTRHTVHSRSEHRLHGRADTAGGAEDRSRIPKRLVIALDLAPVIRSLSSHAGTRRGREAILGLIGEEQEAERPSVVDDSDHFLSSKRRRAIRIRQSKRNREMELSLARERLAPIASSAEQVRQEYELVEQATLALEGSNNLTIPPLYGATSSPWDTDTTADTDHDEWLMLPLEEWTLEHVLQADKVIQTLLRVREWASLSETVTWMPGMSEIAMTISQMELRPTHEETKGAVEIIAKRSIVNSQPLAYRFQLSEDRFPALSLLREKQQTLQETIEKDIKSVLRKLKGSPEVVEHEGR